MGVTARISLFIEGFRLPSKDLAEDIEADCLELGGPVHR